MKFRIIRKAFYFSSASGDALEKYIRPVLQMKILFFWITIKEFLYEDKLKANKNANRVYNILIKEKEL